MQSRQQPIPAAEAASQLRHVRALLILAVDELRTLLINGDDLRLPAENALAEPLAGITKLAESYLPARHAASCMDLLADARRRWLVPGDTELIIRRPPPGRQPRPDTR